MTMVALILLGCLLLFDRPLFALSAIVLAGLVKFAAFLLVPVFLLHLLRRAYPLRRLMLSVGIAAACGWLVLWPLWAGAATIGTLADQLGHMMTMSPAATIVFWAQSLGYSPDVGGSRHQVRHGLVICGNLRGRLSRPSMRGSSLRFAASFCALFAVLVLATFWFRSWYIVWPLAMAAVLTARYRWLTAAGITFSGVGLLTYLFTDYLWVWYGTDLRVHRYAMATVFLPPVLVLCTGAIAYLLPWARARMKLRAR